VTVRQAGMPGTATPPATVPSPLTDLDARLRHVLDRRASGLAVPPGGAALAAVRRQITRRLRRRRRVRHALGSGTLAAGMVAGGIHVRHDTHAPPAGQPAASTPAAHGAAPGAVSPSAVTRGVVAPPPAAAAGDEPGAGGATPGTPPAAPQSGRTWTWDPDDGVDRAAADPGALYAGGRFHVYATSAEHCVRGTCRHHRVPRFSGPDLAGPGRLEGDAMPDLPPWVPPATAPSGHRRWRGSATATSSTSPPRRAGRGTGA